MSQIPGPAPAEDWKLQVRELASRLERDYQTRVARFAKGLDVWGNSTTVGFDIRLGRRRMGPMWGTHVRYARRRGPLGLFGPRVQVRDLAEVEATFREKIDEWLAREEGQLEP